MTEAFGLVVVLIIAWLMRDLGMRVLADGALARQQRHDAEAITKLRTEHGARLNALAADNAVLSRDRVADAEALRKLRADVEKLNMGASLGGGRRS